MRNPDSIKIVYFVKSEHYLSLERHLHQIFKEERIRGEWFIFDDTKLSELETNLYLLQSKAPNDFVVYNIMKTSIQGGTFE